jgi:hypothetical protein
LNLIRVMPAKGRDNARGGYSPLILKPPPHHPSAKPRMECCTMVKLISPEGHPAVKSRDHAPRCATIVKLYVEKVR